MDNELAKARAVRYRKNRHAKLAKLQEENDQLRRRIVELEAILRYKEKLEAFHD